MEPFTIVALGDSLTYGYGVLEHVAFPARLKKDFPKYRVLNKGINGDTTREALQRLYGDVLIFHPQIVLIFLGSNDCGLAEDYYRPLTEFNKNMRSIIEQVQSCQHDRSFHNGTSLAVIITPPPVPETDFFPFTTNDRVELYANAMKQLAKEYGCPVIDLFSAFWAKKEDADFEDLFQFDGLHLSNAGYDILYDLIHEAIEALTKK